MLSAQAKKFKGTKCLVKYDGTLAQLGTVNSVTAERIHVTFPGRAAGTEHELSIPLDLVQSITPVTVAE